MDVSGTRRPKTYATICDLPLELLLLILSNLSDPDWNYWLQRSCSRVCRCLRAACLELIDFHSVNIYAPDSPRHFAAFIEDHPRVARSIVQLRLAGSFGHPQPTINATFVAYILGKLPSLRNLTLNILRIDGTQVVTDIDASASALDGPSFRLDRLELGFGIHGQSHLLEIFRVACLFHVEELELGFTDRFDIASAFDSFSLPRPLFVRSLKVNHTNKSEKHTAAMFAALSTHLQPGVLERLDVSVNSSGGIQSFGRLLAGPACSSLTYLDLKSPPQANQRIMRYGWAGIKDHLLCEWPSLRVGSCPRLESLVLHVYAEDRPSDIPLCSAAAGIFSQAPPTLRFPTLKIWRCDPVNLVNAQWLGLQAVDEALSVPSRFLQLEKLTVWLNFIDQQYPRCRAACEAALAAVHGAGKLEIVRMRF